MEYLWKRIPVVVGLFLILLDSCSQGALEYCQWETFKAKCKRNEVVVMRTARYGRMRLGRCVTKDFGYLGCSLDVLSYMDAQCSGKQSCEFQVPDETMKDLKPCSELATYLEATYTCEKVIGGSIGECTSKREIVLREPRGTIASLKADTERLGTARCPWVIQARPGQRINITLVDFGLATRHTPGEESFSSLVCERYANIKEPHSRSTTICGGDMRHKNIYVSDGHRVEVEIVPSVTDRQLSSAFLLQYEILGCPDLSVPKDAIMEKSGNKVTVICGDEKATKYELTCHGTMWKGAFNNCSSGSASWNIWEVLSDDWSSPHGILVVTCLGVALGVVIGVILLVLALLCMRRKRQAGSPGQMRPLAVDAEGVRHDSMCQNDCSTLPLVTDMRTKEDEYGYRWKGRPLVPIPPESISQSDKTDSSDFPPPPYTDNSTLSSSSRFSTFRAPRDEHIYESPN